MYLVSIRSFSSSALPLRKGMAADRSVSARPAFILGGFVRRMRRTGFFWWCGGEGAKRRLHGQATRNVRCRGCRAERSTL